MNSRDVADQSLYNGYTDWKGWRGDFAADERDARYFALMKSEERKVADIAIENRDSGTVIRPARLPANASYAGGGGGGGGSGLFGWLFGGPQPSQQQPVQPPRRRTSSR